MTQSSLDEEHLLADDQNAGSEAHQRTCTPLEHEETPVDSDQFSKICRLLYVSHFLSTWNSRAFEFGAFLFLAIIFPDTLLPASIYALARAGAAALFAPLIGKLVDNGERLYVIRLSIVGQRVSVASSCVVLFLQQYYEPQKPSSARFAVILSILCLLAIIEKSSAILNTIAVERDWVVVVAKGDVGILGQLNTTMRRIDLFCKLFGPLAISFVTASSVEVGITTIGLMTIISVPVEYFAIARVFRSVPGLRSTRQILQNEDSERKGRLTRFRRLFAGTMLYFQHAAFLPSFALALLYLTVLSFSGQLITYLVANHFTSWSIGLLRAVAAVFELSATWLAPSLMKSTGAIRGGIWFLNLELICVTGAAGLMWYNKGLLIYGMIAAVILSRIGLWGFDLCAQLIIQDEVDEQSRGTFSSQEFAFQNIFEMLAFASTVYFSDPSEFRYPALISAIAVGISAVLYASFVRVRRGHLLHVSRCIDRDRKDHRHVGWLRMVRER